MKRAKAKANQSGFNLEDLANQKNQSQLVKLLRKHKKIVMFVGFLVLLVISDIMLTFWLVIDKLLN